MTKKSAEIPATERGWFKASASATNGACVEVLERSDIVRIRDSKWTGDPSQRPIISVSVGGWTSFLANVFSDD